MRPDQSLKNMLKEGRAEASVGVCASWTNSGCSGAFPSCLVSYVFLSWPTRAPTAGKSHSTSFTFSLGLRSSVFVQSVPSFLTISSNDATRVQQERSQPTALYDTSMQTATNSAVHAERMTRPASLKMHCTKLTSGKVPIPSSHCVHCLIDEIQPI